MATTFQLSTKDLIQILPPPKIYTAGDDLEDFLTQAREYFDSVLLDDAQRNLLIRGFLDDEARQKFDKTPREENFDKRMRKAFEATPDLVRDLDALINYRKGNDSVETYIAKIEKNVERFLRHKLTATKLKSFLLKHCLDSDEEKKEIRRFEMTEELLKSKKFREEAQSDTEEQKGPTPTKYIEDILTKMEKFKEESHVAAVTKKSYAEATKNKMDFYHQKFERPVQRKNAKETNEKKYKTRHDHELSTRRHQEKRCYGCQEMGHIRIECPNIKCSACHKRGHLRYQCYLRQENNDRRRNGYKVKDHDDQAQAQKDVRPYRRERYGRKGRVAALEEGESTDIETETEESGNAKALNSGKMLGAINHM